MSSKTMADNEESSEPLSPITSLPDDIVVDLLARVSRHEYPALSLVSKQFRSLVTSHEIYARRSLLRCTENCLYVLISSGTPNHVGSMIYVFDGRNNNHTPLSSTSFSIDCRSHTAKPLPRMPIPMAHAVAAGFLDGKVYVFRHCSMKSEVMVVFNTETQMWEPGLIKPDTSPAEAFHFGYMAVMANKIYTRPVLNRCVYVPKENKWETDEVLNSKKWGNACVLDDVLYYYDAFESCLNRYDPKERRWGVVKGLDELLPEIGCIYFTETVRFGRNLALHFRQREEEPSGEITYTIWYAEISLGRRQGGDIWGKVEWRNHVFSIGKYTSVKSLGVMV